MGYSYGELRRKKVGDLREIAREIEHEALHGYTTMHKDDLVLALCSALGIDAREHHQAVGVDRAAVKERIRQLKARRDELLAVQDHAELRRVRRQIHRLKRSIRKATV